MKKLLSIFAVALALCLCMTVVSFAATADIVNPSVEGTAVIDGTKDAAYDAATPLEFTQKGKSNGSGEVFDTPQGKAYIINDAEWVYVYFEVYDSSLDNTNSNNYEQDSIEAFWMVDNAKTQIRYHFDGVVDNDSGDLPVDGTDYKAVTTDNGYAVELKLPITDVKDNQIEMCLQINACTDGKRDCTIYIPGNKDADDAYQRANRQTEYDVWWTLALAGEHADTRVDPEEKPLEYSAKAYTEISRASLSLGMHTNDNWEWSRWAVPNSEGGNVAIGQTLDVEWTQFTAPTNLDAEATKDWTVAPQFSIDINDAANYLKIEADAEKGDKAKFAYSFSDITLTAEGYDPVVVPGEERAQIWEIYVPSWGGTAGNGSSIDLIPALQSAGMNVESICDFICKLTNIKFSITFTSIDLVDSAVLEEYKALLDAEDAEKLAGLQEYIDRVEAAKAVIADEAADLAAKQEALDDATKAANRANSGLSGKEYYVTATEKAKELSDAVAEMTATVEELAKADAPAEPADDEKPAEDNKPAENKPAAADKKDDSKGGNGGIIAVVIAVVVIAVAAVAVVLGKKKKA